MALPLLLPLPSRSSPVILTFPLPNNSTSNQNRDQRKRSTSNIPHRRRTEFRSCRNRYVFSNVYENPYRPGPPSFRPGKRCYSMDSLVGMEREKRYVRKNRMLTLFLTCVLHCVFFIDVLSYRLVCTVSPKFFRPKSVQ